MTARERYHQQRRARRSHYIRTGRQLDAGRPATWQHIDVLWRLYAKGLGGCLSYASAHGKTREWGHALLVALRRKFAA